MARYAASSRHHNYDSASTLHTGGHYSSPGNNGRPLRGLHPAHRGPLPSHGGPHGDPYSYHSSDDESGSESYDDCHHHHHEHACDAEPLYGSDEDCSDFDARGAYHHGHGRGHHHGHADVSSREGTRIVTRGPGTTTRSGPKSHPRFGGSYFSSDDESECEHHAAVGHHHHPEMRFDTDSSDDDDLILASRGDGGRRSTASYRPRGRAPMIGSGESELERRGASSHRGRGGRGEVMAPPPAAAARTPARAHPNGRASGRA